MDNVAILEQRLHPLQEMLRGEGHSYAVVCLFEHPEDVGALCHVVCEQTSSDNATKRCRPGVAAPVGAPMTSAASPLPP